MVTIRKAALIPFFFITIAFSHPDSSPYALERPIIYAPARDSSYATVVKEFQHNKNAEICPFCIQCAAHTDDYYYIVYRAHYNFILLNAYPYSKGHLLIIPYHHSGKLKEIGATALNEMMELAIKAMDILKDTFHPQGFNVGFNVGQIAGASVPYHLHMHIVPRYPTTPSFVDTIGNTTIITFDIGALYRQLVPLFQSMISR